MNLRYRLQQWIQRLFIGRNGIDQLTILALGLAGVFALLVAFTNFAGFAFVYLAAILYAVWRSASKHIGKRRAENQRFLKLGRSVAGGMRLRGRIIKEWPTHRYLKCPQCKARLRLPKGKGKVTVLCTKCKHSFARKI